MNARLLIIDPQNDFCDIPGAALPLPGANADMHRLAAFMSPVAGFEQSATAFFDIVSGQGARVMTSVEALSQLRV